MKKASIKEAVRFHGHLGPYLVLGLNAGEYALRKLGCRKYFGLEVKVWGANKKPKSCLIDGLQLATGATYGKGNIRKYNGKTIKIAVSNKQNKKRIELRLKKELIKELAGVKSHKDSEALAKKVYKEDFNKIFLTGS